MAGLFFNSRTLSTGYGRLNITNCALEAINIFANFKDYSEAFLKLSVNDLGRDVGAPTDTLFDVKGKNTGGNEFSYLPLFLLNGRRYWI